MFFWFIGTAVLTVGLVFRDPRFDYRLVVVGSVLPISDGVLFGGVGPLHSLTVSVSLLALVMIGTAIIGPAHRRPVRKLLLGLPIGMILHLVFDAAWNDTDTFWWPFTGWDLEDVSIPLLERGGWSAPLELIGVGLCVWLWRHNDLGSSGRRRRFLADGHLDAVPARLA